jgi:hypothetical protein
MTRFGKILVFINLVLSLLFAGAAIAVVNHRVNWPGTAKGATPDQVEGLVKQKQAEIKKWEEGAQNGLARYEEAIAALPTLEADRPLRQKWYADQLAFLAEGKPLKDAQDKPVKDTKVSRLVYKDGQLELDNKGYPKLEPVTTRLKDGLQPIPQMVRIKADLEDLIQKEMDKVANAIKEEKRLTVEIDGEEGKEGKDKGYRDLLAEEVLVEKQIQAELEYLRPLRYNRQVEAELLLKRQGSLKARLQELEKIGVARRER